MTKVALYTIGTSTPLESNKSHDSNFIIAQMRPMVQIVLFVSRLSGQPGREASSLPQARRLE